MYVYITYLSKDAGVDISKLLGQSVDLKKNAYLIENRFY